MAIGYANRNEREREARVLNETEICVNWNDEIYGQIRNFNGQKGEIIL